MEQLRRLDKSVTQKGTMLSIIIGIAGALLLGVGMSCTMVWKERQKIAPEILRLTEELLK